MNEVKIINKSNLLDKEIDVWGSVERPLFRAKDVVDWLKAKNVSMVIDRVDEEERLKLNLGRNGGDTWFLTEDGLYELLMQSRKPIAKQFKKGVKKILHEIRAKGGYIATTQNDTPATILARAMKVADEVIAEHEKRIKELEEQGRRQEIVIEQKDAQIDAQDKQIKIAAPKAEYYDQTLAAENMLTTRQIANELGITPNELHNKLQQLRIIFRQSNQWLMNKPYSTWKLHGTRTYTYYDRHKDVTYAKPYLVWSQRGRRFILALYKNNFNVKRAVAELAGDNKNKKTRTI